jgi:hypothetical protein
VHHDQHANVAIGPDRGNRFVAFAIARRAPAEQRSGRPDGQRGAIAFGAKRSRAPLAQRDRWPSKAIVPRVHAVLLRSRDSESPPSDRRQRKAAATGLVHTLMGSAVDGAAALHQQQQSRRGPWRLPLSGVRLF